MQLPFERAPDPAIPREPAVTVTLARGRPIGLPLYRRVAWQAETVAIGSALEVPGAPAGGGPREDGPRSGQRQHRQPVSSWLEGHVPDRIVRGGLLVQLGRLLEPRRSMRPEVIGRIAACLNEVVAPTLPVHVLKSGEQAALRHLLFSIANDLDLTPKEESALVGGTPFATSLLSDTVFAGHRIGRLADLSFALSIEACLAPPEHYSADLEPLWGDRHERAELRSLRRLTTDGTSERRSYQAPVSYRILPRVLAVGRRMLEAAEEAAVTSLEDGEGSANTRASGSDRSSRVSGEIDGFDGMACPLLDDVTRGWADVCQLAEHHVTHLMESPTALGSEPGSGISAYGLMAQYIAMVQPAHAEAARRSARSTLLPHAGVPETSAGTSPYVAWDRQRVVREHLVDSLAILAVCAARTMTLHGRHVPPAMEPFLGHVLAQLPEPSADHRDIGLATRDLAETFDDQVFMPEPGASWLDGSDA